VQEGTEPGFLNHVFGVQIAPEYGTGDSVETLVVSKEELIEEVALAGTDSANDLVVLERTFVVVKGSSSLKSVTHTSREMQEECEDARIGIVLNDALRTRDLDDSLINQRLIKKTRPP